jgi:hypothetical protein
MVKSGHWFVGRLAGTSPVNTKLENYDHERLRDSWQNCLETIADPKQRTHHQTAYSRLDDIEEEWGRRIQIGDWFPWPSTQTQSGNGTVDGSEWPEKGVLSYLGYRVGQNGKPTPFRRVVLAQLFSRKVPPVFSQEYLEQWGSPSSSSRLQKMATTIASFTRNAKNRKGRGAYAEAIQDWESDLDYLKSKFYKGVFNFDWPRPEHGLLEMNSGQIS